MSMVNKSGWEVKVALGLCLAMLLSGCAISAGLKKRPLGLPPGGPAPERTPRYEHAGWIIARASIHNHTVYSDGCRTPEDLLEMAGRQGKIGRASCRERGES